MTSHLNESALNSIGGLLLLEPLHPIYLGCMVLLECHESPSLGGWNAQLIALVCIRMPTTSHGNKKDFRRSDGHKVEVPKLGQAFSECLFKNWMTIWMLTLYKHRHTCFHLQYIQYMWEFEFSKLEFICLSRDDQSSLTRWSVFSQRAWMMFL